MTRTVVDQHASEVRHGERFEFGKNWRRFLSTLTDDRIALAEQSLRKLLGADRLDRKSFLDIGSGSGLFSLAARRLGATVRSFDYDPHSVACTAELRRLYYPDDAEWTVEQGSVLDTPFLARLGEFDIVYSWGVLHHTGALWTALENVKPLVRMGGQLYIAIYNDLGDVTDMWRRIKRQYNALPGALRLPFALAIIAASEQRTLRGFLRRADFNGYLRSWTDYKRTSTRGMSRWHDWIDWIGGYPYECASIEAIVDAFAKDGFGLTMIEDRSAGYGCNEFVFRREAPPQTLVDRPLPASRWIARRFGRRLVGPFTQTEDGWIARLPEALKADVNAGLLLFQDETLVGEVSRVGGEGVLVPVSPDDLGASAHYRIVAADSRMLPGPFTRQRRHMWAASVPDFTDLADNARGSGLKSPVYVLEENRQLPYPHSLHDSIAKLGKGRFSHWGNSIYFATSDNSDPNANGRAYRLVRCAELD